jgi:hypothetical protein
LYLAAAEIKLKYGSKTGFDYSVEDGPKVQGLSSFEKGSREPLISRELKIGSKNSGKLKVQQSFPKTKGAYHETNTVEKFFTDLHSYRRHRCGHGLFIKHDRCVTDASDSRSNSS